MRANNRVRFDQVARFREQIGEVERAGGALQRLISLRRPRQLLLQAGGEVGVGVAFELLEIGEQRVARGEDLRSRDVGTELVAAPLPRP